MLLSYVLAEVCKLESKSVYKGPASVELVVQFAVCILCRALVSPTLEGHRSEIVFSSKIMHFLETVCQNVAECKLTISIE